MEEYFAKIEEHREKVSSKEYIAWIYEYVSANNHVDNESALYFYEGIDAENGQLLSAFINYVKEIAIQQRVLIISDDKCGFENEQLVINVKDKYFEVFRMYDQGEWASVKLLNKEPDYTYVRL